MANTKPTNPSLSNQPTSSSTFSFAGVGMTDSQSVSEANSKEKKNHSKKSFYRLMWAALALLLLVSIGFVAYLVTRSSSSSDQSSRAADFATTALDLSGFINSQGASIGQLTVNGDQLNNGDLTVTGSTNLVGEINVGGDANVGGTLSATALQGDGSGITNLQSSNINGAILAANLDPSIAYINRDFQAFVGASQIFRNSTNSVAAFEVQNASSAALFSVNSITGNVGIGTSTPNWNLTVAGQTRLTGHIFVGADANSEFTSILPIGSLFNNDIQRVLTVQEAVSDNSVVGRIYTGLANELLINPQYDPGFSAGNNIFAGSYSAAEVAQGNPYNFGLLGGNFNSLSHSGSGDVYVAVANFNLLTNKQSGNMVYAVGNLAAPSVSGSGYIGQYAGFNALDPQSQIFDLIGKPNLMQGSGTILQQIGVLIDPQRSGTNANWNLASLGLNQNNVVEGRLLVGGCSGIGTSSLIYNCGNPSAVNIPPGTINNPLTVTIPANPVPGGNKLVVNAPTTLDTAASLAVSTIETTDKALVVQGVAGQSANLTEWQSSTGAVLSSVDENGRLAVATTAAGANTRLAVNTNLGLGFQTLDNNTAVQINSDSGTLKGLVVQGAAFGTGNLQEWQAFNGTAQSAVNSAGSFGIGTSTITNRLTVTNTASNQPARFNGAGANQCTVDTGLGSLTCTSDENYKTNILEISGGLETIMQLRGVTYNWKTDANGQAIAGFVAQEVERILPGLVNTDEDGTKSLSKEGLIPYLVSALQEQNGEIDGTNQLLTAQGIRLDTISTELASLTARVDAQDKKIEEQQKQIRELQEKLEIEPTQTNTINNP